MNHLTHPELYTDYDGLWALSPIKILAVIDAALKRAEAAEAALVHARLANASMAAAQGDYEEIHAALLDAVTQLGRANSALISRDEALKQAHEQLRIIAASENHARHIVENSMWPSTLAIDLASRARLYLTAHAPTAAPTGETQHGE